MVHIQTVIQYFSELLCFSSLKWGRFVQWFWEFDLRAIRRVGVRPHGGVKAVFCLFWSAPQPREAASVFAELSLQPGKFFAIDGHYRGIMCLWLWFIKIKLKSTALPLLAGLAGSVSKVKKSSEKTYEKVKFNPSLSQTNVKSELFWFESNSKLTLEIIFL